jgi:NADPH:quinone reductase-like Zn-dependent oxidoreductase
VKAIAIDRYGGADTVSAAVVVSPLAAPGEVRIAVRAASVNPADWKLREGWLSGAFTPVFPYVLGFDGAGVVLASSGPLSAGDRVVFKTAVGRGGPGAFAEEVVVPTHLAISIPDTLSFEVAASLATAGIPAWEAVFEQGRVAAGQRVFVSGGAGGTGSFAVQLATMAGAEVAASGGPSNQAYLASLGAVPIDYRAGDVGTALAKLFPEGVDVVIDTVGQGTLPDPLRMIADGGRLVSVTTLVPGETRPEAERGIALLTATSNRDREAGQLRALVDALARERLAPPAIETLPIARAAEAIERVRGGHVRGKIVLTTGPGDW